LTKVKQLPEVAAGRLQFFKYIVHCCSTLDHHLAVITAWLTPPADRKHARGFMATELQLLSGMKEGESENVLWAAVFS